LQETHPKPYPVSVFNADRKCDVTVQEQTIPPNPNPH
jgi:hypothetical protein